MRSRSGYDPDRSGLVVVLGGGAAGHTAMETIRQEGYVGAITLVTKKQNLPYDSPKLSKKLAVKAEQISLRIAE